MSLTAAGLNIHSGCQGTFNSETIRFQSNGFNIVGELQKPKGKKTCPLVIMVHGDGPAYCRYFSKLKTCMHDAGYATLIWDKPGYGRSTGELSKDHLLEERSGILVDAVEEMKKHSEIDKNRMGVWGISQAGYVIPKALEKTNDIAFMILVGCAGENGIQQSAYQIKRQLESEGLSEAEAQEAGNHFIRLFDADTFETYIQHARPLYDNPVQKKLGFVSALWDKTNWKPHDTNEETFFDPMSVIAAVTIPTLVFFGEKDTQVDPVQGQVAYRKALQQAGNEHFRIEMIPNTDHDIILCKTGSMKERNHRSAKDWNNYAPEYLKIMGTWLRELK